MQVYLVGGAVRDELLGLPAAERDWVVVGATPEQLQQAGYRAVGRDFPVFLHPDTHEEYALARVERKTGPGYRGFATRFSPEVTLQQDLQRRDLTINAMARARRWHADRSVRRPPGSGTRLLRHVSPAFVEDPVRILRVARFAARLAPLGFRLAPDTAALMRRMVDNGEINSLVSERVWREMQRALGEARPEEFFQVLQDCGALAVLLPELDWRAAERLTMQRAARLSSEPSVRFAALLTDAAPQAITALSERLRVPNDYRELALLTSRLWRRIAAADALDAGGVLELLEAADAFRRPDRFELVLRATQARSGSDETLHAALAVALVTAAGVTLPPEQIERLKGIAIAAAYRAARIERLRQLQSERRKS